MTELSKSVQDAVAASQQNDFITTVIMGPQDVGKSVLAMTLSKNVDISKWPFKDPVSVDDIGLFAVDRNCVVGLKAANIQPKFVVDLPALMRSKKDGSAGMGLKEGLLLSVTALKEFVLKSGVSAVVVDTITALDALFCAEVQKTVMGVAVSGEVQKLHGLVTSAMAQLPCHVLFLAHEKANIAQVSADGKATTMAAKKEYQEQEGMEEGDLDIALYFKNCKPMYLIDSSLKLEVRNDYVDKGDVKNLTQKRVVYTKRRGAQTKNKFTNLLKDVEEPNLRAIFQKIGVI